MTGGGKERTSAQYEELMKPAGMQVDRVIPTRSPWSVLECSQRP